MSLKKLIMIFISIHSYWNEHRKCISRCFFQNASFKNSHLFLEIKFYFLHIILEVVQNRWLDNPQWWEAYEFYSLKHYQWDDQPAIPKAVCNAGRALRTSGGNATIIGAPMAKAAFCEKNNFFSRIEAKIVDLCISQNFKSR